MARSLAFWLENSSSTDQEPNETYEGDKTNTLTNTKAELHFNYWLLPDDNINYLDIGVRLSEIGDFSSINLYLPFSHHSLDYRPELGSSVAMDDELISAVFNNPVAGRKPQHRINAQDINFSATSNKPDIRFFTNLDRSDGNSTSLGVAIEPLVSNNDKGVTLKFPRELFSFDEKDAYFRFRLSLSDEDRKSISKTYNPKGAWLNNYFEKSELVDFRVNEIRNLPKTIRTNISGDSSVHKVHFFLIRDAASEYKMGHSAYERCRLLEDDLWKKYLGIDSLDDQSQMLIYHWKGKRDNGASICEVR